jgi:hypothetical protein
MMDGSTLQNVSEAHSSFHAIDEYMADDGWFAVAGSK